MEHLGDKAHLKNLGSRTTKTLYLLKAPLHVLETLAVLNLDKNVPVMTFSKACNGAFSHN